MRKRKISISFTAEDDLAFLIETLIRSTSMKIIQDNDGKAVKMEMEALPVENRLFDAVNT